jgi:hypothetical protein
LPDAREIISRADGLNPIRPPFSHQKQRRTTMIKVLMSGAVLALAVAATPASAQLLGGRGGGGLGGSLGGTLGGITGNGGGSLGGMIERGPLSTDSIASTRTSSRTDKSVDTRKGHVKASNSTATDSALDNNAVIGNRSLTANGSASGNADGGVDTQLVGTDAVRGAARGAVDTTRSAAGNAVDRAQTATGNIRDRARNTTGGLVDRASTAGGNASGSAAGSGSGALSTLAGSASGAGNLALAGSGAANAGAFPINPGMVVTDAKGHAIGTVQSVRSTAGGAVQRVLVTVGKKTADLPAANFAGSGSALVSAMGKGDVKNAAN